MRLFVFLLAVAPLLAPAADDVLLKDYLEQHCTRCHGEKKQKGELRLDPLRVSKSYLDQMAASKGKQAAKPRG